MDNLNMLNNPNPQVNNNHLINNNQLNNAQNNNALNNNARNNNVQQNNPLLNPNKMVGNHTAAQFLQLAESHGWPNAKNEPALILFCNTYDANDFSYADTLRIFENSQFNQDYDFAATRNSITGYIANKANQNPNLYAGDQYVQLSLNLARANQNANQNNIQNQNNNLNNNVNLNNNANQNVNNNGNNNDNLLNNVNQNNNINRNNNVNNNINLNNANLNNNNANEQQHNLAPKIQLSKINGKVSNLKERIRNDQTSFFRKVPGFRNSREYRDARDAYNKFAKRWELMNPSKVEGTKELSHFDIALLHIAAEKARDEIVKYLKAKEEECGNDINKLSSRTRKRYYTMERALEEIDKHQAELDIRQEILDTEPLKSLDELNTEAANAYEELILQKNVHFGSSEYKDALEIYKRAYDALDEINNSNPEDVTVEQLDEARRAAYVAALKLEKYADKHIKETDMGKNRSRRMSAASSAFDSAERLVRKFDDMLNKAMEKPSDKSFDEIRDSVQSAYDGIVAVNWDVKIGSSEFRTARKAYKEFNDLFNLYRDKTDFSELSPAQIKSLSDKMEKAQTSVNAYLQKKAGETNPSKDSISRTNAMKDAKAAILETRRKLEALNKVRKQEAASASEEDVKDRENDSYDDVTSNRNQSFFGSLNFRHARQSYSQVHYDMVMLKRGKKQPTEEDYEKVQKDIEKAKKDISKYIAEKYKQLAKKGQLSEKGQRRLEIMEKAYNSLDALSAKIDAKLNKDKTTSAETDKKALTEKYQSLKTASRKKDGAARHIEEGAALAYRYIRRFNANDELTTAGKTTGRTAIVSLLLNLQKEKDGADKMKGCDTTKEYSKTLAKLSSSKLFKTELSNDKITVKYLNKIANDPNELEKLRKKFELELRNGDPEATSKLNAAKNNPKNQPKPGQQPANKPGQKPINNPGQKPEPKPNVKPVHKPGL